MRINYINRPELKLLKDYSKKIITANVFNKVNELQLSLYKIGVKDLKNNSETGVLLFSKNTTYLYDFKNEFLAYKLWIKGILVEEFDSRKTSLEINFKERVLMILAFVSFIKYAKIETKNLESRTKNKIFNCKYLNETDSNIEIINSTWFTNLIKSDGFNVRGHFRLQPKKKDGEWTKELIWINDFEKSGYTAPARKLAKT